MTPRSVIAAALQACLVQAVRGAEALMLRLLQHSAQAMEQSLRAGDTARRLEIGPARELLLRHQPAMLKGYGLALLETFSQPGGAVVRHAEPSALSAPAELLPGAGTRLGGGGDFASLSLLDDAALQAQLAHHRLLQAVAPQVEIALAELDALISAVQGLERVQPERNPMRPQNYVRALQRVIDDTGVAAGPAACWSGVMGEHLGALLVSEYGRAAQSLRDQGVEPAAYGLTQPMRPEQPSGFGRRQYDAAAQASRWRAPSRYGDAMAQSRAYGAYEQQQAQQEDPTLRLVGALMADLRWMEDQGEGDAGAVFGALHAPLMPLPSQPGLLPGDTGGGWPAHTLSPPMSVSARQGEPSLSMSSEPLPEGWTSLSCMALESVQDAQLEQLMQALQAAPAPDGAALQTLQRMMRFIAADARLLPSVQRSVRLLEPMLRQLVLVDTRFFDDRNHPARQLLDELTARSLWFSSESAPGCRQFLQVADQAAARLAAQPRMDASAFGHVLQQLREAWAAVPVQGQATVAEPASGALLTAPMSAAALSEAGARGRGTGWPTAAMPQAEQIAAAIRRLPSAQGVPEDILEFATGPWAEVIATAHGVPGAAKDPGGYLALVPSLLWSASSHASRDTVRLMALAPRLQARLGAGLRGAGRTEEEIQAFAARLAGLHQDALDAAVARPEPEVPATLSTPDGSLSSTPAHVQEDADAEDAAAPELAADGGEPAAARVPASLLGTMAAASPEPPALPDAVAEAGPEQMPPPEPDGLPAPQALPDPAASEHWQLGTWAELSNARQRLRTQLTWVSPQQTLFLFTAADGSTQSMTRRMRDKLLAQGQLRKVDGMA